MLIQSIGWGAGIATAHVGKDSLSSLLDLEKQYRRSGVRLNVQSPNLAVLPKLLIPRPYVHFASPGAFRLVMKMKYCLSDVFGIRVRFFIYRRFIVLNVSIDY